MSKSALSFALTAAAASFVLSVIPVVAQNSASAQNADLPAVEVTSRTETPRRTPRRTAPKRVAPQTASTPDVAPVAATPAGEEFTSTSSATGPLNGIVGKNTLTGSKTNTPITQVPQAVSVVGREEIDALGAQKPDEALRYTSGVLAQPFGSDGDTNWFFIRGFQATQTGIFQDGLPLYSYAFGGFYSDSFSLERIEVLKGASSVLYGGGNPGGIINYVSKKPDGERIRYIESGITDAGFGYVGLDIGDRATSNFDYRITGRVAGGEGYTDFEDGNRAFINPSFRWFDDDTSLTVLGHYGMIDETHKGGGFLPYVGTVVPASFGYIDRDANYTEPSVDAYDRQQGSIGYELEHKFNEALIFRQNARYGSAEVFEHNLYPFGYTAEPFLNRIDFVHDTTVSTFLLDNQMEMRGSTGDVAHTVLAGIDYKYFNIDQTQSTAFFGTTPPISVINPVYGQPLGTQASYLNQDLTQKQLGVYLQDQARFGGGWILTLNGRYDWVATEVEDGPTTYAPAQNTFKESSDAQASGRAGLGYEFASGFTPYISWATFFNPQLGTTLDGAMFVPETGDQYEAGFKYAPSSRLLFTGAIFDLTRQNVLTVDPRSAFFQVQTGEVTSRGFELEAKAQVTDNLKVVAAVTSYDLEVTKDNNPAKVGKRPYIVPEVLASLWFDYTFRDNALDGVTIGAGVRYLGDSPADTANTFFVPDVTLVDAKIGYEWGDYGIDLNVTNIFDEAYVQSCQEITACFYGEGRVAKLRTHMKW